MFYFHFPGFKESRTVGVRQQTGCERLHVRGRDLPEPPTNVGQRPPMAHPGLLCSYGGGVRTLFTTVALIYIFFFKFTWTDLYILLFVFVFFFPPCLTSQWCSQCLPCLQVVPGSWVDDVTAACEMITPMTLVRSAPFLFAFCLNTRGLGGDQMTDGPLLSIISCEADVGKARTGRCILL